MKFKCEDCGKTFDEADAICVSDTVDFWGATCTLDSYPECPYCYSNFITEVVENRFHKVAGCLGASNLSSGDRETNDFYATDPVAGEWLIKIVDLSHNIYEPACGQGHLAKVFEEHGFNVKATDLIDRGYGQGGVDFLKTNEKFDGDIVTNPPYKYAQAFIEHALEIIPEGRKVCMLLKVQFLEGKQRRTLFENYPPKTVFVSSSRIKHGINGDFSRSNSMMAIAWYVWEKGYKGDTILKWFN